MLSAKRVDHLVVPSVSEESLENLVFGAHSRRRRRFGSDHRERVLAVPQSARRGRRGKEERFNRLHRFYVTALVGLFRGYLEIGLRSRLDKFEIHSVMMAPFPHRRSLVARRRGAWCSQLWPLGRSSAAQSANLLPASSRATSCNGSAA